MCELCKRAHCPPECPNHTQSDAVRCRACGMLILPGDGCYVVNQTHYCEECVESARLEDFVAMCDSEQEEILGALGIRHCYFDPGKE